jgi:putative DNA primase/helicase
VTPPEPPARPAAAAPPPAALIAAALDFAARGWPVFPCSQKDKKPLLGNDRDAQGNSIPKTGGLKKASTDPDQIRAWWKRWPRALIGLATGHGRLFVVDFDCRIDEATGEDFTLERLKAELEGGWTREDGVTMPGIGPLPDSLVSVTPSGGVHLWLTWPDDGGAPIRNRGNLPRHVDVRGVGGYVIAPPGYMPDYKGQGPRDYHWARRDGAARGPDLAPIAQAPDALVALLRAPGRGGDGGGDRRGGGNHPEDRPAPPDVGPPRARPAPGDDPTEAARRKWALAALDGAIGEAGQLGEGQRSNGINAIAFRLGQIVGAGYLAEAMARAGLESVARGWPNLAKTMDTIDRAIADGKGQPRDMSAIGERAGGSGWRGQDGSGGGAGWTGPAGARAAAAKTGGAAPSGGHDATGPASFLRQRLAAPPSTLPSGKERPEPPGEADRRRLGLIARDAIARQLRALRAGLAGEALADICYRIGRWVGAGLVDGESFDGTTRSGLLALGIVIAGDETAQAALRRGRRRPVDTGALMTDLTCARFPLTDFGIAERLNARFGRDYRFTTAKGWLGWDGTRWKVLDQDEKTAPAEVIDAVWRTIRAIQDESRIVAATGTGAHGLDHAYIRAKALRWHHEDIALFGRQSETTGKPDGVQKLARRWLTVPFEHFDCDKLAVNVLNGTLRFSRNRDEDGHWRAQVMLEPHSRDHLNTKIAPVAFDPDAACPGYDDFYAWAQPDAAVRRYLRTVAGYTLTGQTGEQKLWFHYGRGANGKSTAFDIWAFASGDYSGTIGIETFLDQGIKKRGEQASPDLARLGGVRFLRASEPERGAKLNEALIKAATGGEPMAVRALHRGFFDLLPAFKLHIAGNYRPDIPGTDEGIWRRMKLVPWSQHRAEHERNEALGEALKAEAAGVFRWMVEGVLDWLENGLVEPEAVTLATAEYREDSDPLARFLKMCVEADSSARVQSSHLHEVYAAWCKAAGESEWKPKGFAKAMKDKGFVSKQSNGIRWLGIRLVREARDFVDDQGRVIEVVDGDAGTTPPPALPDRPPDPGWDDPDMADFPPF